MKVYYLNYENEVSDTREVVTTEVFHATQGEVRAAVRALPKESRHGAEIEEREYATNKEGIVAMLNGVATFEKLREWRVTARGGLEELA